MQINKTFTLAPEQVRDRAEQAAQNLAAEYKLSWAWSSPTTIDFKGVQFPSKGVTGRLTVSGQTVSLLINLPAMTQALAGSKIEAEAKKYIDAIDAGG